METRKIQKVSNGTYTVSLPKRWAEDEDISAGTVVDLHTHIDGLLVVQAPGREDGSTGCVTVQVAPESTERLEQTLRAAYTAGYEEVVLDVSESFTDAQKRVLRRVTRSLAGMTVTDRSDERVVVRNLLDANQVSVRQSVRQLQFVALSMHREATAVLTGDGPAENLSDRDDEADRLYAMVDRHFCRGLTRLDEIDALGATREELFRLHATARELERIADHAERIATVGAAVENPRTRAVDDIADIAETARGAVDDAVAAVVADADTAAAALNARDRVREEAETLDRRLFEAPDGDYRLTYALDGVRRTAEHAGNIAEVGLRTAIRDGVPAASPSDTDGDGGD
ncbi:phosphate signaling complex PhoU family protein [Halopelagius longus]|uniref:Phosphate uptake regulator n=1 Tax=Halopelagius longus TaxID=1236180 RepID=A0A1H0XND1_9EURY|nr:phosphate uptake regulator PhoU [Halopelagius longus]RDI71956.1 phosphate uptake regulator PhoU [Halopelagius longus]SDQ04420.1 Phosphate uptake regulator [Halopelagius longus]